MQFLTMKDWFLEREKRAGHIVQICIARSRILPRTTGIRLMASRRLKLCGSSFARPEIDDVASFESPPATAVVQLSRQTNNP
jgi:hypothetical protein